MVEINLLGDARFVVDERVVPQSSRSQKRLALITYLALERPNALHSREKIIKLLWPEFEMSAARNSLSNMVYQISSVFGNELLVKNGSVESSIVRVTNLAQIQFPGRV